MKTCFKCKIDKPVEDFYRHSAMADGHLGKCKECTKMDVKIRYISEPEKIKEYELKRSKTQKRLETSARHTKEWRLKYPERYKAHTILNNSIRKGILLRPKTCEICGDSCNPHGHHHDYSKPLDVIWLCAKCHGQIQ